MGHIWTIHEPPLTSEFRLSSRVHASHSCSLLVLCVLLLQVYGRYPGYSIVQSLLTAPNGVSGYSVIRLPHFPSLVPGSRQSHYFLHSSLKLREKGVLLASSSRVQSTMAGKSGQQLIPSHPQSGIRGWWRPAAAQPPFPKGQDCSQGMVLPTVDRTSHLN